MASSTTHVLRTPRLSPAGRVYAPGVTASKPELYRRFWSRYLHQVAAKHPAWPGVGTADGRNWLYQSSPIKNCRIAPGFKGDGHISHEFVIMAKNPARNAELFAAIQDHKPRFEETYGRARELRWDERGTAKRYLIGEYSPGLIEREADADDYIAWFIDCGERLRAAVGILPVDL
jgi:hypothetical protein